MTADLGFTSIRGLDEGLKPTRIYYTGPQEGFVLHPEGRALNQPVPLIKTFLVDHQGIRLTKEKSDGLKAKILNEEKAWRSRVHNGCNDRPCHKFGNGVFTAPFRNGS